MDLKSSMNLGISDHEMKEQGQPVNPISQAICSSLLSLSVNVVFEFEEAITDISRCTKSIVDAALPRNPLFSCIMKEDDQGVLRWEKTAVNINDHTFIAEFPPGQESYDACVDDYISKLALAPFDHSRPLCEFHFLNYKTNKAKATMVFRFHHALGDGISFMSTLFCIARRVDNPDLPPTFPTAKPSIQSSHSGNTLLTKFIQRLWYMMLVLWYTLVDVISSLLRMTGWIGDSQMPIRGPPGVKTMPVALSSATFLLEDLKQIKNSVGGTVNDVITGIIFYGMQRYLQIRFSAITEHGLQDAYEKRFEMPEDAVIKQMEKSKLTALCLINMRGLAGLQSIDEMVKPKAQAPWGNHFGFLPVRVPMLGKLENPIQFVRRTKSKIDRHKISLGTSINGKIMAYLGWLKGPQAVSRYLYNTLANSTFGMSNLIGPTEKVAIDGNPIKSFSFFVSGAPQSLELSIVSYTGVVVVQVYAQKAYVDANMLCKCFIEACEEIKKATPTK
uniref:Uncharacterized protein n=1 Tax=Picea sitchensis TaxID=3332 RepID=D5AE65_PICSI|nr:unknown [Picea sitchensis]